MRVRSTLQNTSTHMSSPLTHSALLLSTEPSYEPATRWLHCGCKQRCEFGVGTSWCGALPALGGCVDPGLQRRCSDASEASMEEGTAELPRSLRFTSSCAERPTVS